MRLHLFALYNVMHSPIPSVNDAPIGFQSDKMNVLYPVKMWIGPLEMFIHSFNQYLCVPKSTKCIRMVRLFCIQLENVFHIKETNERNSGSVC
jgi:hypothetical protein